MVHPEVRIGDVYGEGKGECGEMDVDEEDGCPLWGTKLTFTNVFFDRFIYLKADIYHS